MNGRNAVVAILSGLLLLSPIPGSAAGASEKTVSVYIGKSSGSVKVFGWIVPTTGRKVTVKLWKDTAEGRRLIDEDQVAGRRNEQPPYGSRQGTYYSASLRLPASGDCMATVRLRGSPKATNAFPCATPQFGTGSATLTGDRVTTIDALIADDGTERGYGLMYRRNLAADKGMAFLFPEDQQGGFWMKNTLIPLSIAFVDASGVVVDILDMDPCWTDPCPSYAPSGPYRTALEVNQGAFETWGIAPGDRIDVTQNP